MPARTSAQRRFHTKNTRIVRGELNDGCALVGRHGRAHRHRPYPSPLYFSTRCALTSSHCTFDSQRQPHSVPIPPPYCTFDSSKSHGVPIPHRGYTFDSAGLASATQPTLGNNASEEATPLGGCTFSHHTSLPHAAKG